MQSQCAIGVSMSATVTASVSPTPASVQCSMIISYLWSLSKILYLEYYDRVNYVLVSLFVTKTKRQGQGCVTNLYIIQMRTIFLLLINCSGLGHYVTII